MTKQENSKNIISLNPYSTGSNSNMTIATVLNTQGKRLNPYSTGSNSNKENAVKVMFRSMS